MSAREFYRVRMLRYWTTLDLLRNPLGRVATDCDGTTRVSGICGDVRGKYRAL